MHRRGETVHIGYSAAGCGTKVFTNMVQVGEGNYWDTSKRTHGSTYYHRKEKVVVSACAREMCRDVGFL